MVGWSHPSDDRRKVYAEKKHHGIREQVNPGMTIDAFRIVFVRKSSSVKYRPMRHEKCQNPPDPGTHLFIALHAGHGEFHIGRGPNRPMQNAQRGKQNHDEHGRNFSQPAKFCGPLVGDSGKTGKRDVDQQGSAEYQVGECQINQVIHKLIYFVRKPFQYLLKIQRLSREKTCSKICSCR